MSTTLYALLVGIDNYQEPVPLLNGCVNDITVIETLLRARTVSGNLRLEMQTLRNGEATRQAVIDGFLKHLSRAKHEDVALFYYSGHGSQERTPPEFWHVEPDRLDETLVCYDSRSSNSHDLADKELAKLIAHVAKNDPHVLIVLDCCHSGSGTRALPSGEGKVRRAPTDTRERKLNTFLITPGEAQQLAGQRTREGAVGWLTVPRGHHILMAACREDEEAKEVSGNAQPRGAFSYYLSEMLQSASGGSLTYRDLFKRVNALVRAKVARQSPVIEATDIRDLDRPFLGGAIQARAPYFTVSFDKGAGWVIDGGAVHGIPAPVGNETTTLALFDPGSPIEKAAGSGRAIGDARVIESLPTRSKVALSLKVGNPDPTTTYGAIVTGLPLPPLSLQVTGEDAAVALFRKALATSGPGNSPSWLVRERHESSDFQLLAEQQSYRIRRTADDRPLVVDIQGANEASARQAVENLEHIARWTRIAEMGNPCSRLAPDAVKFDLFSISLSGEETLVKTTAHGDLRFSYDLVDGKPQPPQFKMRLQNQSNQRLYCMLLDLPETFAVSSSLLEGNGVWLDPGAEAWAKIDGNPIIPASIPAPFVEQGLTEIKDILKLIVSTDECDATLLDQDDLGVRFDSARRAFRALPSNTLDRLMYRVNFRHFGGEQPSSLTEWTASELSVTIVCPRAGIAVPAEGTSASLAPNVVLSGHSGLKAVVRLSSAVTASRDADLPPLPPLPPWLVDDPSVVRPFQFSTGRGGEAGLSALELDDVTHESAATVTPDAPLIVRVQAPLAENEYVVPLAFDGEFFLPLGWGQSSADGVDINLVRLPRPLPNARSLTGSIRIFFKKVISEHLGLGYEYPVLAAAEPSADGRMQRITARDAVRSRVQQAQRILLYIHGIIGDTSGMAASAFPGPSVTIPPAKDFYDLILTFDYENLNTPIEHTARDLKRRLQDVGLQPGHGKQLHIAAHSMGGLVSRWFIEHEGGDQVVQHLIMLGTPNGGSPWPVVADWITMLVGLGLNGFSKMSWAPSLLGQLTGVLAKIGTAAAKHAEVVQVALQEMNPKSEFLQELSASQDPRVRYSIVAGNTSLLDAMLDDSDKGRSRLARLLARLSPQRVLDHSAALAFFGSPNDIAVSVAAIGQVPTTHTPQPLVVETACDHLSYFNSENGLKALAKVLG